MALAANVGYLWHLHDEIEHSVEQIVQAFGQIKIQQGVDEDV